MEALTVQPSRKKSLKWMARFGFISKGIVYILLGVVALLAAIHTGGNEAEQANKAGVFEIINEKSGLQWMVPVLGIGLACYSLWRMVQSYYQARRGGKARFKALRYFLSGALYVSIAVSAFRVALESSGGGGDNQQQLASEMLSKPFGQWLLGIVALILTGVGVYQIYYGLSGKFKKHVERVVTNNAANVLVASGKLGYTARGIVWLIISYLLIRAAVNARSSEAGDTSKAFKLVDDGAFGPYLLALLAIGLIAYGVFCFVRARYEEFNQELR